MSFRFLTSISFKTPNYLTMEYLEGESLAQLIKNCLHRKKRMPTEIAAGIIMQAAEGLHHAHTLRAPNGTTLNIVHR